MDFSFQLLVSTCKSEGPTGDTQMDGQWESSRAMALYARGQECPRHPLSQPSLGPRDARRLDAVAGTHLADGFGKIVAHGTLG